MNIPFSSKSTGYINSPFNPTSLLDSFKKFLSETARNKEPVARMGEIEQELELLKSDVIKLSASIDDENAFEVTSLIAEKHQRINALSDEIINISATHDSESDFFSSVNNSDATMSLVSSFTADTNGGLLCDLLNKIGDNCYGSHKAIQVYTLINPETMKFIKLLTDDISDKVSFDFESNKFNSEYWHLSEFAKTHNLLLLKTELSTEFRVNVIDKKTVFLSGYIQK